MYTVCSPVFVPLLCECKCFISLVDLYWSHAVCGSAIIWVNIKAIAFGSFTHSMWESHDRIHPPFTDMCGSWETVDTDLLESHNDYCDYNDFLIMIIMTFFWRSMRQDHPLTLSQWDARIWSLSLCPPPPSFWKTDLRKCETWTTGPIMHCFKCCKLPFNQILPKFPGHCWWNTSRHAKCVHINLKSRFCDKILTICSRTVCSLLSC